MKRIPKRLSAKAKAQLKRAERSHPSPRVRWRARLVLCWGQGHSLHRVAQVFGCKWETVQAAVRRFHQGGVPALADAQHPGRPRQVSKKARQALFAAMHATPQAAGLTGFRWTAQRVQQYLRRAHQHQVSRTTAWREIRRCGRSRKRGQYYLSSPDPLYAEKKGR